MTMIFSSSMEYPSGRIIQFNVESAKENKDKDTRLIYDQLALHEEISAGIIYKRKDNGDLWYVNPADTDTFAKYVTEGQLELLHKWDKPTLLPTEKQFNILKEIGGLPSLPYSIDPADLRFPAAITTNTGENIDLCVFYFSQAPPFPTRFKKIMLLSDVAHIEPSELALSHELRLSSMFAEEIRMGFYPFMVRTFDDRFITYNGITQFASTGHIKGNEIESEVEFSFSNFDKVSDVSSNDITVIVGKWDQRLQELFDQYRHLFQTTVIPNNTIIPKTSLTWWQRLFSTK